MAAIRFTGWRVSVTTLFLSIMALLASAMFALAQENALFQRVSGVALDLSADQQSRVVKIQNQGMHQSLEFVLVDSGVLDGSRVSMPLADGAPVFTLLNRIDRAPNDYTWIGTIAGSMDQAVLVVRNGEVTGQIDRFAADGSVDRFSLTPLGGELHVLAEVDTTAYPPDHRPGPLPVAPRDPGNQRTDANPGKAATAGEATAADGVVVDVLVAYTPAAASASSNIQNTIQLAVDLANTAYSVSNANVELRLVGTMEATGYSESGKSYEALLNDVTGVSGNQYITPTGIMGTIHARRDTLGADMVVMMVNHNEYCGLAWVTSSQRNAFSVTTHGCVTNHTFAHELGHNFGAVHDVANSSGSPAYPYGYGYIHPGNLWRTIQSYGGPCGNCTRINQFSNPDKTYGGAVTGTATTHNVARLHRERVSTVAAFRPTASTGGVKAAMTSPAPGSTLTTTSATFSWSAGTSVTEYWLDVGSSGTGSNNIYNASTGTSTSRAVSGLPASGTLNVRLWSRIAGNWQYNDYTYTMQGGVKAVMSSPTPGSTLTSTSATFSWSTGIAVTEYWLYVGTTGVGSFNIHNQNTGTARSSSVSGLPSSGTLYVRLFSRISGVWQHNDYTYTMNAGTAKAVMSSPVPGTTINSDAVSFSWTEGSGVAAYWLYVGSTGQGSFNLYNQNTGTARTRTVSGLPASGTIYVRLYSQIAGAWQYNDYTYTMSVSGGAKAAMSSPTPGSTLTSNSATFSWTAGTGVTEYWFTVGTTGVGSGNIINTSTGLTRSRAVSGLPVSGTLNVRLWSMISGAWQYTDYTYTMAVGGGAKAAMSSPTPGSTLTSNSATFSWTAGTGVTEYWITVGTTGVGSRNIIDASTGTVRSRTVNGLPSSGALNVRLWSMISGAWQYSDYTYTMSVGGGTKAAMTSPTPGSTLSGTSATFSWTAGSGVSQYWITVGTTGAGSGNIVDVTTGTALSRTVSGLPTSGSINVRLWSLIGSAWQYTDYAYTGGGGASNTSSLITPSNGVTLSNPAYFQWQAISGATEYWIEFGFTPNGAELYTSSQGTSTSTSFNFTGFAGETLYMRLGTRHGGTWRYMSYTFRAPSGDAPDGGEAAPRVTSRLQSASAQ